MNKQLTIEVENPTMPIIMTLSKWQNKKSGSIDGEKSELIDIVKLN